MTKLTDAVREKLDCCTVEGCSIMNALKDTEFRGKVKQNCDNYYVEHLASRIQTYD